MTTIKTGSTGPTPTVNVPHVNGVEQVIIGCPKGSYLSIQDRYISCVQRLEMSPNYGSLDSVLKIAALAYSEGRLDSHDVGLKDFLRANAKTMSSQDWIKVVTFRLSRVENNYLGESIMDQISKLAAKHAPFETQLQMLDLAVEFDQPYDFINLMNSSILHAESSKDLIKLSEIAKLHGYAALARDADERAARLKKKGR